MKDEFESGPAQKPKRKKRERTLEKWAKDLAKSEGWLTRKYRTPGHNGAPDDMFAKFGHVFWVEFKKEGEEPNNEQLMQHGEMREAGLRVYLCDNKDLFKRILAAEQQLAEWKHGLMARYAYTL